ncbi:ferrous iron transport protein C [Photobacterium damselae subsp. piscicida]|uniref:FeoC-like transcriptional regulator n=1 Tax=Photobacterium damsela subsp. piscicida TaxID=38294 RepID=A0A1Q9H6I2_PHODP|nr:FeoC-like transcriptional regulator [Photobacterium damselae]MBE8129678.1 FeoC-like transcriptional regulator [Photobacterium damselae subsp. piscicida]MDP2516284.1 FeoC-like transcriptional regulator [Photobacterium damselae subsp. piscicida]MDP2533121.1 FeoC-like transcriptional regulator [Photobacterium damselae subsp. piscicida]MDP2542952.1 FeoC-like transcriptional regulator [Photobacterium damselae subsp. piscicida]MDP2559177.1 FeoC-like transcriptional regulator [Photobacterium damse
MILQQLKQYIEQHGRTSRKSLAKHFALSEDGVDAMLEVWIRKGIVSKELVGCSSDGCCQSAKEVWYRLLKSNELSIMVMR